MTTPAQATDDLYQRLKAGAYADAISYVMTRTPPELQALMLPKVTADFTPLLPTQAIVANNQVLPLEDNFTNALGTVTVVVAGGVATKTKQALNANLAMINAGGAVVVRNAANNPVAGSPGAADVTGSNLNFVKLTV